MLRTTPAILILSSQYDKYLIIKILIVKFFVTLFAPTSFNVLADGVASWGRLLD